MCTCVHPVMSLLHKCYLVVWHTLSYTVSNFEVNWTNSSWDTAVLHPPPVFLIWPLSDHPAPETWLQNWPHNNWSPSLPRPQQMPLLAHWQVGQHPSACPSMTWIPKMPITPSPYFTIPWRTGSSSTVSCQTVRTTSDMFLQPWEPNPWRCTHNGCLLAVKRNRKWPRQKVLPSSTKSNREWHMMSTPMYVLENSKILWPDWERTPKILLHTSRHWWTAARWSTMSIASMNCIAVSSMHTAMRESSLGNLWQSHSRHPPVCWPTLLWITLPSNKPRNKSPTAPNLWTQSTGTKGRWSTPGTVAMVTHHLHPPRTVPTAHDNTQLAEQAVWHVIPIVPNATKWDIGDQNAEVQMPT